MDQLPYSAVFVIERESRGSLNFTAAPKEPGYRIIFFKMIIGSGNEDIALSTDEVFVTEKMIPAGITKPWKEKTYDIVPEIIEITHAAS